MSVTENDVKHVESQWDWPDPPEGEERPMGECPYCHVGLLAEMDGETGLWSADAKAPGHAQWCPFSEEAAFGTYEELAASWSPGAPAGAPGAA